MRGGQYRIEGEKLIHGSRIRPATDAEIALWQECERLRDILRRAYERLVTEPSSPRSPLKDAA